MAPTQRARRNANFDVRAAVPDLPFVLLDRYEVIDEIGRGGHAIVLRARDRILDRMVAVKVLRDDVFSPELLTRFRQEVQVTAQLEHSNILHVYDTGEFEGRPYLVMELANGETLSARLEREGQLPIEDALRIADEVGMALAHAHARGVIHRDVKPDNILLGDAGAVLADFGIARVTAEHLTNSITSTGTVVGTVLYMSPEQLCADPRIDARSDQYALACVVYEMLAGVRPHVAATFDGLRMLRVKGQHLPVSAHRPAVSPSVDHAIQRALASMPADRFRGVNEFLEALRSGSSAQSTGVVALRASSAVPPGAPASFIWSGRTLRVLSTILGVGLVAVAGYQLTRSDGAVASAIPMRGDWDVVVQSVVIDPANTVLVQSGADTLLEHALQADLELWTGITLIRPPASTASAALHMETRITPKGDSARIQITLTGARGDTTGTVSLMAAAAALQTPAGLAGRLVRRALVAHASLGSIPNDIADLDRFPARSLPALLAYARGFDALAHGALDSAEQRFSETVRLVPPYAEAFYWQAQTGSWRAPANRALWRPAIDQSVAIGGLHGIDSMNALALQHLSRAEYPDACRVYRAAAERAPRHFVSWYGLGECQRLDPLIERRGARLVFRSSHWSALDAYQHAIETAPTSAWLAALYAPIAALSYTEAGMTREGFTESAPRTPWYALPSLMDDTIGFLPLSEAEFLGMGRRSVPVTLPAALRRGRMVADELTARWLRTFPDAADALYQRALARELLGDISAETETANALLDRAEQRTQSSALKARIAVARIRVALRHGALDSALSLAQRAIADSALFDGPRRARLAPLAALRGDLAGALRWSPRDSSMHLVLRTELTEMVTDFTVRALLDACSGLEDRRQRMDDKFRATVAPAERELQWQRWMYPAYRAAIPCLNPVVLAGVAPLLPLDSVHAAIAGGDRPLARHLLQDLRARREGATSSTLTWDYLFAESWALAEAGDSLEARKQLTSALEDIGNMSSYTLSELAQAAGLRRGILLLRALAGTRARYVSPVESLWVSKSAALTREANNQRGIVQ